MKLIVEVEYESFDTWLMQEIDAVLDQLRAFGEIKLAKITGLPSEITIEESN